MDIEQKIIKSLRKLSLDQIYHAKSGHLGMSFGCANIMYAVYKAAKVNPQVPDWVSRDRVVLSAGHGSALLYSCLHLFGFLSKEELQTFRLFGGLTGHPEIKVKGVDCATGALGQGIANAVGLAFAEKFMTNKYNTDYNIFDNYTFCICGDGDLMEGISYEAASFAGRNKLNKLIVLYDSNRNSLDGKLANAFNEDVIARFQSQNWATIETDGNDFARVYDAISQAKQNTQPTIIICNSTIGYDTPLADSHLSHSMAIDDKMYARILENLDVGKDPFVVPQEVYDYCQNLIDSKISLYKTWQKQMSAFALRHPRKNAEIFGKLCSPSKKLAQKTTQEDKPARDVWGEKLQILAAEIPNLLVGSADLAKPTRTVIADEGIFDPDNTCRNIAFGVREASMSAMAIGFALYSGNIVPVISTFLVFSDYMRAGIRMSAIMEQRLIYIFTHDSVLVGEDGVTHQPVEQIESLRAMPRLNVFRPCDETELGAALDFALGSQMPTAICLTNQKMTKLANSSFADTQKGGYILSEEKNKKELHGVIVATGSEVGLALKAQQIFAEKGYSIRVVSMPNRELFFAQDEKYQDKVLPKKNRCRLVLEMGATQGWYRVAGLDGAVIGVDDFGETGSAVDMLQKFNYNLARIVETLQKLIQQNNTYIESII